MVTVKCNVRSCNKNIDGECSGPEIEVKFEKVDDYYSCHLCQTFEESTDHEAAIELKRDELKTLKLRLEAEESEYHSRRSTLEKQAEQLKWAIDNAH